MTLLSDYPKFVPIVKLHLANRSKYSEKEIFLADELAFLADDLLGTLLDLLFLHWFLGLSDLILDGLFLGNGAFFRRLGDDGFGFDFLGNSLDEEAFDLGGFLTNSATEEVKFGSANVAFFLDFDLGDGRSFNRENLLDTDVIGGDTTNNEGLQASVATNGDNQALKNLSASFVAFGEGLVDTNSVPDSKVDVLPVNLVCHSWGILTDCGYLWQASGEEAVYLADQNLVVFHRKR